MSERRSSGSPRKLLGAHELGRPDHETVRGELHRGAKRFLRRETEVHHHGAFRSIRCRDDHDVFGLEVAVDNAVLVGHVEACRHVSHERGGDRERQLAGAGGAYAEEIALDIRHHDVVEARGRLAQADDVADVRVGEFRAEGRLSPKARHRGAVVDELRQQLLDRDSLAGAVVAGEVDEAHPAFADHLPDLVAIGEQLSGQITGIGGWRRGGVGRRSVRI